MDTYSYTFKEYESDVKSLKTTLSDMGYLCCVRYIGRPAYHNTIFQEEGKIKLENLELHAISYVYLQPFSLYYRLVALSALLNQDIWNLDIRQMIF